MIWHSFYRQIEQACLTSIIQGKHSQILYCCKLTSERGARLFDDYAAGIRLEIHEQKTLIMQIKNGIEKNTIIIIEPTLRPEPSYSGVMQLFVKGTVQVNRQHALKQSLVGPLQLQYVTDVLLLLRHRVQYRPLWLLEQQEAASLT